MVSGLLSGAPCVWVGKGFVPVARVALQGSLDLAPWLYVLPAELAPFQVRPRTLALRPA